MLDLLGENVTNEEQAERAAAGYAAALRRIEATGLDDANISIKLTQLGLDISEDECVSNCERVLRAANGTLVMIDMESSEYTERTIAMFEKLRAGHDNVGVCLQAALHRTPDDVRRIAAPGRADPPGQGRVPGAAGRRDPGPGRDRPRVRAARRHDPGRSARPCTSPRTTPA